MIKNDKDAMIRVSKDTRYKLKVKALKVGLSLKEYLKRLANQK